MANVTAGSPIPTSSSRSASRKDTQGGLILANTPDTPCSSPYAKLHSSFLLAHSGHEPKALFGERSERSEGARTASIYPVPTTTTIPKTHVPDNHAIKYVVFSTNCDHFVPIAEPPSTAFLADSVTAVCGSPLLGRELARRLHQRNLASRLGRLGPGRRAPSGIDGVPVLAGWLGDVGHGSLLSNLQESGQLKRKPG